MNLQEMQLEKMTLGEIAMKIPSATAVFRHYGLDFCCSGNRPFDEAIDAKGLEKSTVLAALQEFATSKKDMVFSIPESEEDYKALTGFIVERFHNRHRRQFPELIRLAKRVEKVHASHARCPKGLSNHLEIMYEEMSVHMQKEEGVLFPLLCRGQREDAQGPILIMESEHEEHGHALKGIRQITQDLTLPEEACNTWRVLYQGLAELEEELIQHIHTENNILFAR